MNARLRLAGLSLAATTVALASSAAGAAPTHESLHGTFSETARGAELGYDIHGSAKLTVGDGSTVADINIEGLDPTMVYSSHLHNGACGDVPIGGGHYQNVESSDASMKQPPNELWLSSAGQPAGEISANPGGVGHATGSASWSARLTEAGVTNARSIVVHAHDVGTNNRIACADLG